MSNFDCVRQERLRRLKSWHPVVWIALALWVRPGVAAETTYRIVQRLVIDTVPSWFPVRFDLITHGQSQYVAYYNAEHQMVVARRGLTDEHWQKVLLPTRIGWDSHNYVTMAVDASGRIHLAGNMHCVPLMYFRTRSPGDITTFERLPMTGEEEQRCTYPRFLTDADGHLLFTYRSGSSGNGRRFYNIYDVDAQRWTRFLDKPLFDGEGQRNAYPVGPVRGPDRLFHVVWVWRDTPDCATNHHLSYARSRDLKHWETAGGQPVTLPLTLDQTALCVDPVPPGGGIINGCEKLAFNAAHQPVIAYHKSDENRYMQIYVARFEKGQWHSHPITTWEKPIRFSGGGAMPFIGISISSFQRVASGTFLLRYRHRDYGAGQIVLDETTLQPVRREVTVPQPYPRELRRPTISFPGIAVRTASDHGHSPDPDVSYILRWETLDAHHDRPRRPPLPPASILELVSLQRIN